MNCDLGEAYFAGSGGALAGGALEAGHGRPRLGEAYFAGSGRALAGGALEAGGGLPREVNRPGGGPLRSVADPCAVACAVAGREAAAACRAALPWSAISTRFGAPLPINPGGAAGNAVRARRLAEAAAARLIIVGPKQDPAIRVQRNRCRAHG